MRVDCSLKPTRCAICPIGSVVVVRYGKFPPPPINQTLGLALVEVGDGRAVFELTPAEWHHNPIGSVHGGILATLADSALGCAVHTKLSAGTGYTSLDLTIKFTRAATLDSGTLTCEGHVVTIGRRRATAEAQITDKSGRVMATPSRPASSSRGAEL